MPNSSGAASLDPSGSGTRPVDAGRRIALRQPLHRPRAVVVLSLAHVDDAYPFGVDRQRRLGQQLGDVLVGEQRVGGDRKHAHEIRVARVERRLSELEPQAAPPRLAIRIIFRGFVGVNAMPADTRWATCEGGVVTGTVMAGTGKGSAGSPPPSNSGVSS